MPRPRKWTGSDLLPLLGGDTGIAPFPSMARNNAADEFVVYTRPRLVLVFDDV